jgi:hypothetical protein
MVRTSPTASPFSLVTTFKNVVSWVENVKIPASKMAAIKQSPVPPPPPLSFCEGPRILQNFRDVVFQIVELPLYILSFLAASRIHFLHPTGGPSGTICLRFAFKSNIVQPNLMPVLWFIWIILCHSLPLPALNCFVIHVKKDRPNVRS